MPALPTDFLLVRCELAHADVLRQAATLFCAASTPAMQLHRAAWSPATGACYAYGRLLTPGPVDAGVLPALADRWRVLCPGARAVDVARLQLALDVPGQAQGSPPVNHYVVETDPEEGWAEEIARWYDTEHMPGLAAVPGCIHARRLLNHDNGPRSFACYDLVSEDTLGSPPWLAVRGTPWSSRARPHFTNTRRTMMQVVA